MHLLEHTLRDPPLSSFSDAISYVPGPLLTLPPGPGRYPQRRPLRTLPSLLSLFASFGRLSPVLPSAKYAEKEWGEGATEVRRKVMHREERDLLCGRWQRQGPSAKRKESGTPRANEYIESKLSSQGYRERLFLHKGYDRKMEVEGSDCCILLMSFPLPPSLPPSLSHSLPLSLLFSYSLISLLGGQARRQRPLFFPFRGIEIFPLL